MIDHILARIRKPGHEWLVHHLCGPRLSETDPGDLLRDFVVEGLGESDGVDDADFRIKAFKMDQWSFRWTLASLRTFQMGAFPLLPFYDTRMTDFFCTVPTEMMIGRRLQIDYLRRFAPDLARVEWEGRNADLFGVGRPNPSTLVRRGVRKAWRTVTGRGLHQRNWEIQFLSAEGRQALTATLQKPGSRLLEYVPGDRLSRLLDSFFESPSREHAYPLSMLLTLSTWMERYG